MPTWHGATAWKRGIFPLPRRPYRPYPTGRGRHGATRRLVSSYWRSSWGCRLCHGISAPRAGIELGAPANPVDDPGTARPEWSFRGLYQLHETLRGWPELVSIFVIPTLTVLFFFAVPWIGRNAAGLALNCLVTLAVLAGLGVLTWQSYARDAADEKYQAALRAGQEQAERIKELAVQPSPEEMENAGQPGAKPVGTPRIPVGGAVTLLRDDAKVQGPRLFNQYFASCHDYSGPSGGITRPPKPTAADLYAFASRPWLTEFLSVKGITDSKFFGNTKFKQKKMYGFIKETFADLEAKEQQQIIQSLSHESLLKSQREADAREREYRRRNHPHHGELRRLPCLPRQGRRHGGKGPGPDRLWRPRLAHGHHRQSGPSAVLRQGERPHARLCGIDDRSEKERSQPARVGVAGRLAAGRVVRAAKLATANQ